VIYWVGQAVERKKDFDGNQLNVPDLLGADINRAARILSVAKDNQMLINDEIVKKINKNVSIKNELLGQKINISEMHKLNGLKNIKGNVVVSEVSYKKAFLGIDEKYQDMLVFLDSKVETKHVFNKLINDINDWKNSNRVDAEGLLFSLILLGDRALAIRMKSLNLEKHRDCLIEMMKNCDVGMAHTYIIHSKIREITENLDKYRFKYGALLLFSFVVDKPETYKKFEKQIAQNNSRNTNVSILDAGTIFGDFEAYAIVDAKSHDDLYAFVHSTRNLPGMNDVETLVYPIVKLRQM
jgi:DNA-binding Lrp family transcriptional regulator